MPSLFFAWWRFPSLVFISCCSTRNSLRSGNFHPLFILGATLHSFQAQLCFWAQLTRAVCCISALIAATMGPELSHLSREYSFLLFCSDICFLFMVVSHFQLVFVPWSTWIMKVCYLLVLRIGLFSCLLLPSLMFSTWQTVRQTPTQRSTERICTLLRNCWQQTLIVMETDQINVSCHCLYSQRLPLKEEPMWSFGFACKIQYNFRSSLKSKDKMRSQKSQCILSETVLYV